MPPRTRPYPLLLTPRYLQKPWGGRRIETVLGRKLPVSGTVGESWEVYDRDGTASVIRNGPLAGKTLADVRDAPYPLLVKILDAERTLSVQVHPDAEAARTFGGEPKSECWFVLAAEEGAQIFRGLKDDIGERELREAIHEDRVAECLHTVPVKAGDAIYIPAGTIHSVGGGVLLAEVQQNSDTTFRIFDWGRKGLDGTPRDLHVEEAVGCARFGPRTDDKIPPQLIEDEGTVRRLLLAQAPFFAVEHVTATGVFTLELEEREMREASVLHVLSGQGQLRAFRRGVPEVEFNTGDTILLPEDYDEFEVSTGASVLRALLFRP